VPWFAALDLPAVTWGAVTWNAEGDIRFDLSTINPEHEPLLAALLPQRTDDEVRD